MLKAEHSRARTGFTLVELLVVIMIIGILATLAIPRLNKMRETAKTAQTASNLRQIHGALSSWGVDNNSMYPFRVRWYDPATTADVNFNPNDLANYPPALHSEPNRPWFSMGLFGGVQVVNSDFSDNTQPNTGAENDRGVNKHKIIQPFGWTYNAWYQYFNEYTDPLIAQNYLESYPENPFLRRPMGAIMYGYGNSNWNGTGPNQIDKTIPAPEVVPSPGDFVYTHFYHVDGTTVLPPHGVVPAKKSYSVPNFPQGGTFYVDQVDGYQLWAFGALPFNGATYVAYPNNSDGLSGLKQQAAKKDWDNSGSRDLFELGMAAYFKTTGSEASQAQSNTGGKMEF